MTDCYDDDDNNNNNSRLYLCTILARSFKTKLWLIK
jgi:hypothetical protein